MKYTGWIVAAILLFLLLINQIEIGEDRGACVEHERDIAAYKRNIAAYEKTSADYEKTIADYEKTIEICKRINKRLQ